MLRFARWHIWLGWLVGFPVLMWTATGLFMVLKPIEEVRGNHLRIEQPPALLAASPPAPPALTDGRSYSEMRVAMQDGRPVWLLTDAEGNVEVSPADASGEPLPEIDEAFVRAKVAREIVGGDNPARVEQFSDEESPFDFRRPVPSWRVTLQDGAHVYLDGRTGQVAAVRTQWWRAFDFMWGLHIMDLRTRELDGQSDFNHAMLVLFATLAVVGSLLGCALMFRRRKARVTVS